MPAVPPLSANHYLAPAGTSVAEFMDAARASQDEFNIRLIDAAAGMGAGHRVAIAGGMTGSGLTREDARKRASESLAALDRHAGAVWPRTLIASGYGGPVAFERFDRHRRGRAVPDFLNTVLCERRERLQ